MLTRDDLHPYQVRAVQYIKDHRQCGLFLGMGLGKTASTLTAIADLMYHDFELRSVLVIAPLRVARDTWANEVESWAHLQGLTVSVAVGTAAERRRALEAKADIYTINRDNVTWLCDNYPWTYDMCVIDELSSFKSPSSKRFKSLRKKIPATTRVVGLTGTPAPNSLMDLWSQIYLLDKGERLGKTLTRYRMRWFRPGKGKGYVVYEWIALPYALEQITEAISDITMSMTRDDSKDLPPVHYIDLPVSLPDSVMEDYTKYKREMILELPEGTLTADSAGVLANKLRQYANGAVYVDSDHYREIHTAKIDALLELVEFADGPVLVAYEYKHDKERILKTLQGTKGVAVLDSAESMRAWMAGNLRVGIGHPASIGHGLNLQSGGHTIIWYSLTWSLELYQQYNARLHRQGQTDQVQIYHLIAKGTIDERILRVLGGKEHTQSAVLEAVREELSL